MHARAALLAALLLAAVPGCKKAPQLDVPLYPGAAQLASGGNREDAQALQIHLIFRTPDGIGAVRRFYDEELVQKRGWKKAGNDVWEDGGATHSGDFGQNGAINVPDPSQPAGWMAVVELPSETRVDLWRSLPKKK